MQKTSKLIIAIIILQVISFFHVMRVYSNIEQPDENLLTTIQEKLVNEEQAKFAIAVGATRRVVRAANWAMYVFVPASGITVLLAAVALASNRTKELQPKT